MFVASLRRVELPPGVHARETVDAGLVEEDLPGRLPDPAPPGVSGFPVSIADRVEVLLGITFFILSTRAPSTFCSLLSGSSMPALGGSSPYGRKKPLTFRPCINGVTKVRGFFKNCCSSNAFPAKHEASPPQILIRIPPHESPPPNPIISTRFPSRMTPLRRFSSRTRPTEAAAVLP